MNASPRPSSSGRKVKDATINRELGYLRAAFRFGHEIGVVDTVPRFRMVKETNIREGFISEEKMKLVASFLRDPLDDLVKFAFFTGWRKSAVKAFTWSWIDWQRGVITMPGASSKNHRAVVVPIAGEIEAIMRRRWTRQEGEYVFHRWGDQVRGFRHAWQTAVARAGVPDLIFHDLRRSFAHLAIQRGLPEAVIMKLAGWRTNAMFKRYAIINEDVLKRSVELMSAPSAERLGPPPPLEEKKKVRGPSLRA